MASGGLCVWIVVYLWASVYTVIQVREARTSCCGHGHTDVCLQGAITMSGCGVNSPLEVTEDTQDYVITCTDIGGTNRVVRWDRSTQPSVNAGSCPSVNNCQPTVAVVADLSRPYYSTSTMTVKSATRPAWGNREVRCFTTLAGSNAVIGEDSCLLDVVYPGEASCDLLTNRWTVSATCTISKVFSSASRYTCQFFTGSQSSQTTQVTQTTPYTPQSHQDPDYRTGSCGFSSWQLPSVQGDYSFRAVIVPGNVAVVFGSVTVATPPKPNITCTPSRWVPDGSTVSCVCHTTSLGQPAGKLQGFRGGSLVAPGSDGGSLTLTLPEQTVTKTDHSNNNVRFSCAVDWIQDISSDVHTVSVTWGPTSVTIPQSRTFVTDMSWSRSLNLTCEASDVNPAGDLTYIWTGRCQGNTGSTCTFHPQSADDDCVEVTCTVRNSHNNNQQRSDTYSLDLHYPPPGAPVITRSRPSPQPLYAGDDLTLTCRVTGGKPLVTSVSLSCGPRHPDNATDVRGSSFVSSSVHMTLTSDDDGITCLCTAAWEETSVYTPSDSDTLTVLYPPDPPEIHRTDTRPFPYLEGDTARLSCDIQGSWGNPTAILTWPGHGNGQTTNPGGTPATLVLPSVGRGDNNRNITCTAVNRFTEDRSQPLLHSWILQVYYSPVIRLSGTSDTNQCQLSPDQTQCTVTEGQRVYITSTAHSNPDPDTFLWTKQQNSGLDLGTGSVLDLDNTSHQTHNGIYTLTVTTGDLGSGRGRLTESKDLLLRVRPLPVLTLNSRTGLLEVMESQAVDVLFECRARDTPQPNLILTDDQGRELARLDRSDSGVGVQESVLSHVLPRVRCEDSALYTCTADNGVDSPLSAAATLRVLCQIRVAADSFTSQEGGEPAIIAENSSGTLSFQVVTTESPSTSSFLYLGTDSAGAGLPPKFGLLRLVCGPTTVAYRSECIITANNVTGESVGYYNVSLATSTDSVSLTFRLLLRGCNTPDCATTPFSPYTTAPQHDEGLPGMAAGIGIGIAIMLVFIIGVVIWLWRRQWKLPCAGGEDAQTRKETSDGGTQPVELTSSIHESHDTAANPYEELNQREIGLRSVYQDVKK